MQVSTPRTLVDIVIPVYGTFEMLEEAINSIPDGMEDIPYHVYIIEDGSPNKDEANAFCTKYNKDMKFTIIRNPENRGYPISCNKGAFRGRSPLLFFSSADVVLAKGSGKSLVNSMDDPSIGIVGMKLLFPDNCKGLRQDKVVRPAGKVQHIGLATNIRGEFYHLFLGWNPDHPKVRAVKDVYAVTGAAFMTRRSLFTKAGGFQIIYGLGTFEDLDLSLTIREMGYNIIVDSSAVAFHYTGSSAEIYQRPFPLEYNRMTFMQRWGAKLKYTEMNHL